MAEWTMKNFYTWGKLVKEVGTVAQTLPVCNYYIYCITICSLFGISNIMFPDIGFSLDLFSYLFREAQVEKRC